MELITLEQKQAFEKQGNTCDLSMDEIQVICKLFNPVGAGSWWLYEDVGQGYYRAFVSLDDPRTAEIGIINLPELTALKLPFGLKIERDINFEPRSLQAIIKEVKGLH